MDMSAAEWSQRKNAERSFHRMHLKLGERVTRRAQSCHSQTRGLQSEVVELKQGVEETISEFVNLEERITKGLHGMAKEQCARAYKEFT